MRFAVYIALVALAAFAALTGNVFIAVALGGAKALLVGMEYMELRQAARPHAFAFAFAIVALVGCIGFITV